MPTPILKLDNLSKFYTSAQNVVVGLNNISLSFSRGEFVAITGESGSGKSTLAHVIGGILPYESGEMYLDGRPTSHFDGGDWERYRRDSISFISQSYGILLSATVLENVVSALRLSGMDKKSARSEAKTILEKVELWELRSRRAAKLSSGQKQRLSIARALAKPAPILIADEPTGNLDPENSAKVMTLLAQAAQTRLVLLITHDFQEAEALATRRISLLDGEIVLDAPLATPREPEPLARPKAKKKELLTPYVSRLQLGGRPIWMSFVLLFFALTAFAVFAFLGTFIVALDDTNTRWYDNSAFPNGDTTRIVVQRPDGEPMTQEDYETLLDIRYVAALDKQGYLWDINCFYEKDVDHRTVGRLENVGSKIDPIYEMVDVLEFLKFDRFCRGIPLLSGGETFLTAGREPEKMEEVVLYGDESLLGQTFRVYLLDEKNWAISAYIYIDVTVVGVTDYAPGVYFHEDLGRVFGRMAEGGHMVYLPDKTLEGTEVRFHSSHSPDSDKVWTEGYELKVVGLHDIPLPQLVQVSYEMFDTIAGVENCKQVTLTVENYAYTTRVLDALKEAGYSALSPYRNGATQQLPEKVEQRSQTLLICICALVLVVLLQVIVLRALFGSEFENYRLLEELGLTCAVAKRSVVLQVLLFTALGQGVAFGALWQCNNLGVERIVSLVRYLPRDKIGLLMLVHLGAALMAGWWIARSLQKKVYPLFIRHSDLQIDDEEATV